jgi:hypothetical protein
LALYDIYGPHDHGHVHVHVHDHDHSILSIRVDRFNPAKTPESSNSRPKGFSVARGQGDPWSIEYQPKTKDLEPNIQPAGTQKKEEREG